MSDNEVGLTPSFRDSLSSILSHAASQERTVIEFRTTETASGNTHLSQAIDITEHVAEMENDLDDEPDSPQPPGVDL
jgi:hypothetical protein